MFPASNIPRRLARWAAITAVIAVIVLGLSGRWTDPWLWAFIAVFSGAGLYVAMVLTDDLARERFRPPEAGADRHWLKAVQLIGLLHVIVGALDVGRWQLTNVPTPLRTAGLIVMIASVALIFYSMTVNRFFSTVIRIQKDRGHQVVDQGPYSVIRHPGYAGMIPAVPAGALVMGSWLGFALAVVYSLLMLRRVWFEDWYLRENLAGYMDYTQRVRHRLIPRVW
jgi:protein-S-isoprenylcysteine O-methyltransferase Ste14